MDTAVKPGDDFFRYVNGKWLATAAIPADKARFGMFDALRDKAEADVRALVDELGRTPAPAGTVRQKVADLYASWMDEARDRGARHRAAARRPRGDRRGDDQDRPDPADGPHRVLGAVRVRDQRRSRRPDALRGHHRPGRASACRSRDYYLTPGEKFDGYRAAYQTYVTRIFELLGDPAPAESAATVIALETKLAQVHWPRRAAPRREGHEQPDGPRRPGRGDSGRRLAGGLEPSGLGAVSRVVVREVTAIKGGAALLDTEPVAAWKKYLAFHLADDASDYLPKAFDDASFDFHSKTLRGVEVQRERWKRGVALLDGLIGEGVGELYVASHFPPEHKAAMDALVANLRDAMGERLKTLDWMDDTTRAEALQKLATFEPRIGYPSKWRDYSRLHGGQDDALRQRPPRPRVRLAAARRAPRQAGRPQRVGHDPADGERLLQPVDRTRSSSRPRSCSRRSSIRHADPAVNYGGIGAVIGHEMGHGFDDQGRKSDGAGKLRNWWTDETNARSSRPQTDEAGGAVRRVLPAARTPASTAS